MVELRAAGPSPLRFAATVTAAHVVTYLVVGAVAYPLLTRPFYEGPDALFTAFMRTPADPGSWRHASPWIVPAQVLRGLLLALALAPFAGALRAASPARRFAHLYLLLAVVGFWSSSVAAPGTVEGLVFLRPEFTPVVALQVQPEILVQLALFAAWVSRALGPGPAAPPGEAAS